MMSIKLVQISLNPLSLASYINIARLLQSIVQHWRIINKFIVYTGVHCGVYSLGFGGGMMMFTNDYSVLQNNSTYSLPPSQPLYVYLSTNVIGLMQISFVDLAVCLILIL